MIKYPAQQIYHQTYVALPRDLTERCAEDPEFITRLDASCDVADEYCADLTAIEVSNEKVAQQVTQAALPFSNLSKKGQ